MKAEKNNAVSDASEVGAEFVREFRCFSNQASGAF